SGPGTATESGASISTFCATGGEYDCAGVGMSGPFGLRSTLRNALGSDSEPTTTKFSPDPLSNWGKTSLGVPGPKSAATRSCSVPAGIAISAPVFFWIWNSTSESDALLAWIESRPFANSTLTPFTGAERRVPAIAAGAVVFAELI